MSLSKYDAIIIGGGHNGLVCKLGLNQLFSARPLLGHADYRGPVQGLYLCGSGAHPGGAVTGIPGHNAAREMLRDRRWLTT